jgi:F0F1-type ATP synthase membrane subunit b/b'
MQDVIRELLHEIADRPMAFAAEIVQTIILIGILAWAARRYGATRLAERHSRIAAELTDADAAVRESAALKQESLAVAANGEKAAAERVAEAREVVSREREASLTQIDVTARAILEKARNSVEQEKASIRRNTGDRLIRLTSEIARRYIDEFLTDAERQELTRKAVRSALERMEADSVPSAAGER